MSRRVLNIVPTVSQEADGVAKFVLDFYCNMKKSGFKFDLAALRWKGLSLSNPEAELRLFSVNFGLFKLGFSNGMMKWINQQNINSTYEIIHSHGLWMMPGIYVSKPIHKRTYKLIVSTHGSLSEKSILSGSVFKKPFWHMLQKKSLKQCDCFHATSLAEYHDIRKQGFTQPVCIIPPGVSMPVLIKKKINKRKTLLFLARIAPIKGIDILLEAWSRVEEGYCEWDLVISGPDCDGHLDKMINLSKRLNLNNVNFIGPVYGDKKKQLYVDSDLYILPSYSENFGITIAEALSHATPVITTKNTPWSGVIENQAGWWVDSTVDSLTSCLKESLATDDGKLKEMGMRGRNWMAKDFSWNIVVDKFNKTYEWMCTGGEPPKWIKE